MIDITNIHSLSDFRQNTKQYVEQLQANQLPLILTVNGEASIVVEDAAMFQATQSRLHHLEQELQVLKYERLKEAVMSGVSQLEQGACSSKMLDDIAADVMNKHHITDVTSDG